MEGSSIQTGQSADALGRASRFIYDFETRANMPVNADRETLDFDARDALAFDGLSRSLAGNGIVGERDNTVHFQAEHGARVHIAVQPIASMLGELRRIKSEAGIE